MALVTASSFVQLSAPLQRRRLVGARSALRVRAQAEPTSDAPIASTSTPAAPAAPQAAAMSSAPPMSSKDTETLSDLMAFSGPVPERINGRLAMLGFVAAVAAELSSGAPVLQQSQQAAGPVLFTMMMLTGATIIPKFASRVPLSVLLAATSKDKMPKGLEMFDGVTELWTGRVAMIGLVGLAAVELYLGKALF